MTPTGRTPNSRRYRDLIDRVVQLRRADRAAGNASLRGELTRLKQANRALERELRTQVLHPH